MKLFEECITNMNFIITSKKKCLLITIIFLIGIPSSRIDASMFNKKRLTGYIEISHDLSIGRVNLSTGKVENIIDKNVDFPISTFDLSPVNDDRVVSLSKLVSDSRLVIYDKNKNVRVIINKNFVSNPAYSPDGNSIAYLYHEYKRNRINWSADWHLYIIRPDGSLDRKVSEISLDPYRPSWFPDNKKIAVSTKNLDIYIIDIGKGIEQKIIDFGIAPALSGDGKNIAYLSKDIDNFTKKRMVDQSNITTREYEETVSRSDSRTKEMRELTILFNQYSIYLFNIATGKTKKITEELAIDSPVVWSPDDKYLIYNDERYLGHDIYAIEIKTGKRFKATSERGKIMTWKSGQE